LPNCQIIERCNVNALQADSNQIRAVDAICDGRKVRFTAKVVVLAAGAIHSPQILLRSCNEFWPQGLANSSDQVGRNLMFHTNDVFAIWAPQRLDRVGRQKKAISVRDFYVHEGQRLGYVQSMGLDAGRGVIASFLKDQLRRRGLRNELLLSILVKLPSHIGAALFGQAGIFAGMTEDDPNPENRIILAEDEPDGASFTYTISDDLRRRAERLYKEISRRVRPWRLVRLSAQLDMNYGHPCGTCRFGDDPARSVLNRYCRTHDIDNLYVVDASFMPRSGAVNPSLTIAANALRVGAYIAERSGKNAFPIKGVMAEANS
jgi:choline dehydrogenase-like flavoprotein